MLRSFTRLLGIATAVLCAALVSACWLDFNESSVGTGTTTTAAVAAAASDTLSGTAAVGAPIVSGNVIIKCAAGQPVLTTTGADGSFLANTAAITFPCALQISGGQVNGAANTMTLHSLATATGNTNITTLTELAVARIAAGATATFFQNLGVGGGPSFGAITAASISSAIDAVRTALLALGQPVDVGPIGNFFTAVFQALAGDPLDAKLEALRAAFIAGNTSLAALSQQLAAGAGSGSGAPAGGGGTLTASNATPASGNGTLAINSVKAEDAGGMLTGITTRVVVTGTNSAGAFSMQIYFDNASGNVWNISYSWTGALAFGGSGNASMNTAGVTHDKTAKTIALSNVVLNGATGFGGQPADAATLTGSLNYGTAAALAASSGVQ